MTITLPPAAARRIGLAVSVLLAVFYGAAFLDRGWIPHDEGLIAQSAERVLTGELPHRDYDEPYTGGLTYAHALAFHLSGVDLISLRYLLFAIFVSLVAALYALALRLTSPGAAVLVALLGAAWSVPNYFASLPSWYNLFLAVLCAVALFRHIESGKRRWLFLAGLCAGLSILVKIVGLYLVAAALLFLAYREQALASGAGRGAVRLRAGFLAGQATAAALLVTLLIVLFLRPPFGQSLVHFVLPGATLTGLLVSRELSGGGGLSRERFRRLSSLTFPFLAGLAFPTVLFLIPYVATGSLSSLARGLFELPQRQITTARMPLAPLEGFWLALPFAAALRLPRGLRNRGGRLFSLAVATLAAAALLLSSAAWGYRLVWTAARALALLAPLAAAALLASRGAETLPTDHRQRLFLLAALTALIGLVQYPFSAPIYFCYVAPIAALLVTALARPAGGRAGRIGASAVLLLFLGFAVLRANPGYVFSLGRLPGRYEAETPLSLDRGRLRVPATEAEEYGRLIARIRLHAGSSPIYATPDCPEVYFLAGRPNPTRYFFDFLSDGYGSGEEIFRLLREQDVRVVVVNHRPHFSRPHGSSFLASLAARYPRSERIGRFTLFWK